MSQERSRRGRPKSKASASGKGADAGGKANSKAGGKGAKSGNRGKAGGNKGGRKGGDQKQRQPGIDPRRPFWTNPAEAEVQAIIGQVSPAHDPVALVQSLGSPPLGRFGDNAQHYYAAVYEKAQRYAIAMATANGVLVTDGDEGADADDGGAEGAAD